MTIRDSSGDLTLQEKSNPNESDPQLPTRKRPPLDDNIQTDSIRKYPACDSVPPQVETGRSKEDIEIRGGRGRRGPTEDRGAARRIGGMRSRRRGRGRGGRRGDGRKIRPWRMKESNRKLEVGRKRGHIFRPLFSLIIKLRVFLSGFGLGRISLLKS